MILQGHQKCILGEFAQNFHPHFKIASFNVNQNIFTMSSLFVSPMALIDFLKILICAFKSKFHTHRGYGNGFWMQVLEL
jgi:hypothetical protein